MIGNDGSEAARQDGYRLIGSSTVACCTLVGSDRAALVAVGSALGRAS